MSAPFGFVAFQQQGAVLRTGLADRGDVDRGIVHHRAFAFADAAADAQLGTDVGLLEGDLLAIPARDGLLVRADRLGAGRADLLADHTRRLHRPGQAAALVEEGRAQANGALLFVVTEAEFFG